MTSTQSPPPVVGSFPRSEQEIAARVKAIESLMIEKGIMTTEAVDRFAEIYEHEVGPQIGAAVVAKAWSDDAFRERLVANATEAERTESGRRTAVAGVDPGIEPVRRPGTPWE